MSENIERLEANAFTIPTASPESDGTVEWSSTTLVLVRLEAQRVSGLGYSYAHECCVPLIRKNLFPIVQGKSPFTLGALWNEMNAAVRNFGRNGIASSAIAAVETALWDLKARILNVALVTLLGAARGKIPAYGSGGFTSYTEQQLASQLETWANEGLLMVKMKVGREPDKDEHRVVAARRAIGKKTQLFVDANGAYAPKQALEKSRAFAEENVSWFEEPVSSDDLKGLRFIRGRTDMEISAGEYNYDLRLARAMLESQAVDVLQADATRCGVTGFLETAALCDAYEIPLSAHTAPALHAHLACAAPRVRHIEYFYDHVRIEQMFFAGATTRHQNGFVCPDLGQPGLGLEFKSKNAEKYRVDI